MKLIERAKCEVQREYLRLWAIIYGEDSPLKKADLMVQEGDDAPYFSQKCNSIVIHLSGHDLTEFCEPSSPQINDAEIGDFFQVVRDQHSGTWRRILLHEMIHEYQFKRLEKVSPEGQELCKADTQKFSGPNCSRALTSVKKWLKKAALIDVGIG